MQDTKLTSSGLFLQNSLAQIAAYDKHQKDNPSKTTLHVQNVGSTFITSYEQLRSVAENIEDHMLTQAAIMRFYKRSLIMTKARHKLGKELVIELTLAGYLNNDTTPLTVVKDIDDLVTTYTTTRSHFADTPIPAATYDRWLLELLTVQTEQLLQNPIRSLSFVHFAHHFLSERIDYERLLGSDTTIVHADLPKVLYLAIHKQLLKSNNANARSGLMQLYDVSVTDIAACIEFNQRFDAYSEHRTTRKLIQFVAKNGAPLHIIKTSYFEQIDDSGAVRKLETPAKTEAFIESNIDRVYETTKRSVIQGIVKSSMFLLLAYAVIGLLIEIPFEMYTTGKIQLIPLSVNLLLPIIFLIIGVVTYKKPADANKSALQKYIRSMLHKESTQTILPLKYPEEQKRHYVFEIVFALTFALAFYLIIPRLVMLQYTIIEGILFIFLFSVGNFLGYRLTLQYRDIEHVTTDQGFFAMIRNFIYLPFVFMGRRIVRRSEKFNVTTQILDVMIDLPLKTVVRLIRQWLGFLQGKKDEIA